MAQVPVFELVRLRIEPAMHLPEFTLSRCCFGSFSSTHRVGVYIYEWEVAINEPDRVHQLVEHLFYREMSVATVRTFIIAVVDYCHQGIRRANRMIALIYRNS
jgi:hypothetical protein